MGGRAEDAWGGSVPGGGKEGGGAGFPSEASGIMIHHADGPRKHTMP